MVKKEILISEVSIILVRPHDGLIGFASCIFEDRLYLSDIAIHSTPNGDFRLVYPSKKINNRNFNIYYPINKETGKIIQFAIVEKYKEIISKITRREKNLVNYDIHTIS